MSDTAEALKVWDALKPMIDKEIERQTRSCVRAKKMTVTRRANGETIGVAEPYGEEVEIPYNSGLAGSRVGMPLWVYWYFNNASTMVAFTNGSGSGGTFDLDALQAQITNLRGDVATISLSADSIMTQISDIEGNISTLQQTAISLESKIEDAGGDYSDIRQTVDEIQLQVVDLQDADTELSGRITVNADAITSEVTNRRNGDDALSSRITQNATAITSEVTNRQNAVSGLEGQISTVQQTANGLEVRVGTIESDGVSRVDNTAVEINSSGVHVKSGGTFQVDTANFYTNAQGSTTIGTFTIAGGTARTLNDSTGQLMLRGGNNSYNDGAGVVIYALKTNPDTGELEVDFTNTAFSANANSTRIENLYTTYDMPTNLCIRNIYTYDSVNDEFVPGKVCTGASKSGSTLTLTFNDGSTLSYP